MALTPESLAQVMRNRVSMSRYRQLFPAYNECLIQCGCTTIKRAAMLDSQLYTESGGLTWMEEIADGSAYEGRADLGNTQPGDGRRFKGRGPIQVTGRWNYTNLSKWAHSKGYVPTPTFFVDNPAALADDKYGFLGVVWYWTTQRPMNAAADAGDVTLATKYVNGGTHGLDERKETYGRALQMGDKILPDMNLVPTTPDNKPDFNEVPFFLSGNSNSRNPDDIDLWLLHTQEPPKGSDNRNDAAFELRNFLESTKNTSNPVSYHYTGSMANDGGTTIADCVDTDDASFSVGNSNYRSINFCFAGTRSDWTRQQWLDNERGTIEAAAYLFVQDCKKYPKLKARVIAPNYSNPPGAADHNYCTVFLKDGNDHTDVGPNFPWDVFTAAVNKYANGETTTPPVVTPPVTPPAVIDYPKETWDQLRIEWDQLGNRTVVNALGAIGEKLGIEGMYDIKNRTDKS